ncbi:hypothetical protein METP1_02751 [Methanosarcinales archaeon]|nr:hypothetical protein METP1_02751 [Methanosarcinales archaeon]
MTDFKPQTTQSASITATLYEREQQQRPGTQMTRIRRIFTYTRASASSAQSVFHRNPSAFICVHLRLIFVSLYMRFQKIQNEFFLNNLNLKNTLGTLWCLIILKDKPQMNADERRFVIWGSVYINSFLILFDKNSGDTYS